MAIARVRPILTTSAMAFGVLALAACGGSGGSSPSNTSPVLLGLIGPLTGARADVGQGMVTGAKLALDIINKDGGVLSRHVNLDVQDDTSATPRKIIQRAVIAAVDALRTAKAQRTERRAARCSQYESQARVCDEHALKSKATQMGQKRTKNSREMHRKLYQLPIQLHRN